MASVKVDPIERAEANLIRAYKNLEHAEGKRDIPQFRMQRAVDRLLAQSELELAKEELKAALNRGWA